MNKELIYSALFNRLRNINGIKTASRKIEHFNNVPPINRPALYLVQGDQTIGPVKGLEAKEVLEAEVFIYLSPVSGAETELMSTQVNDYIYAVEQAIKPEFPEVCEYQTLGGLVEHCWIQGVISVNEAVQGMIKNQAIVIIPIKILITN